MGSLALECVFLYHSHHGKPSGLLNARISPTEQSYLSPLMYPRAFPGQEEQQVEFVTEYLLSISHTVLLRKVAGGHLQLQCR